MPTQRHQLLSYELMSGILCVGKYSTSNIDGSGTRSTFDPKELFPW